MGERSRESAQRRGVAVLLANSALMSAGFYMLIPLLSVHLTRDLGFSGAAAGAVLALRQFTQQGLMLFGGALADRVGFRPVIAAGMLVRALGFFGFALSDSLPVVLLAAVVAALGGALFEATGKAALASLAAPHERARLFSMSAVSGGLGSTGGPLIGTLLLPFSFAWVGLAAGAFFFLAFVISALLLPPLAGAGAGDRPPSLGETLRAVSRDRAFLGFTALLTGYWFLHNQIYISVPLRAVEVAGSPQVVGLLYAVNAGAGLVCQYPLVRLASAMAGPLLVVAAGIALMGVGLGVMALTGMVPLIGTAGASAAVGIMIVAVVIFAAGRALVEPTKDAVTASMARPEALASYFGVSFLALAFGGSAGNYAGGWLFDVATATGLYPLPWIVFACTGLLIAGGMVLFSRFARVQ